MHSAELQMTGLLKHFDIAMCCLWIITEFLCLIGIIKYKKSILPPLSQLVIAPFEFAVVIFFVIRNAIANYALYSYFAWAIIEIIIVRYYYKYHLLPKKLKRWYVILLMLQTIVLLILLLNANGSFAFFGVFNTLIAIIIWFVYLYKTDYPMNAFSLCVFILKLFADTTGSIAYISDSPVIIRCILIAMVTVDICFLPTWFYFRKRQKQGIYVSTEKSKKSGYANNSANKSQSKTNNKIKRKKQK